MLQRIDCIASGAVALTCAFGSCAQAQSIGDYSRAQRAVIEAEMARDHAKALSGAAPQSPARTDAEFQQPSGWAPPGSPAAAPSASTPAASRVGGTAAVHSLASPDVQVAGVVLSARLAWVEVSVDGVPYLLRKGQAIPGTSWKVAKVLAERVELAERPAAHQLTLLGRESRQRASRSIALPARATP